MSFPRSFPSTFPGGDTYLDVGGTAFSRVTDWTTRGRNRLIEEYKDKPILAAILDAFEEQLLAVSNAHWQLLTQDNIEEGGTTTLDREGRIVGAPERAGLELELYRLIVKAQALVNRSKGRPEDLLSILALLYPSGSPWEVNELFPAAIESELLVVTEDEALVTYRLLKKAKDTGVRFHLIWNINNKGTGENAFQFSSTDAIETDSNRGFGDTGDLLIGGTLSGVF